MGFSGVVLVLVQFGQKAFVCVIDFFVNEVLELIFELFFYRFFLGQVILGLRGGVKWFFYYVEIG